MSIDRKKPSTGAPDVRQLRYFVAVAEELHFHRAARRVYVTQPSLSHQIARLEAELGVRLLERTQRRVALTPAGETFLRSARLVLGNLEQGVAETRRVGGRSEVTLRIGYPEYVNYSSVPNLLRAFCKQHPDLSLDEQELNRTEQLQALRDGKLDVGFMQAPVKERWLACRSVWRTPLFLLLPAMHPLAALEEVPLRALDGERFMLMERSLSPAYHDLLQGCFAQAGAKPSWVLQPHLYSRATLMRMVAAGVGLDAVLPSHPPPAEDVVTRPLVEPTPVLKLLAVWRRDASSPALSAFLGLNT